MKEIREGFDQHADNQTRFGLPSRLIAKTFVFRLLYGGSAWSYANDFNFKGTSSSENYWQRVIDSFYEKYSGIHAWHTDLLREVDKTGRIVSPSGRIFTFERTRFGDWPVTKIKNYPVQGFAADLVMLARISLHRRMSLLQDDSTGVPEGDGRSPLVLRSLLISSVHDSIVLDIPAEECYNICTLLKSCIEDIPANAARCFKIDFNLPMTGEIFYGPNKKDMELWKPQ